MSADSQVRIWAPGPEHITLSYAQVRVHYSEQGERIRDRLGLLHRISAGCMRYPTGLVLGLLAEELTMRNTLGPVRSVLDWLEYQFRAQSELVVFLLGETLMEGGGDLTRPMAYKAYLDELPPHFFGTLPTVGGGPEYLELTLTVHEDGTFTDFSDLGTYSACTPARPGSS
jgi:hypothetical protein